MPLTLKDQIILFALLAICIAGFFPALKNFFIVIKNKEKIKMQSETGKNFVVAWTGLGVICIVLGAIFCVYSLIVRWPN